MKYNRVAYLCDGKACGKQCANLPKEEWDKHPCHHTTDESHARNKVRRARKFEHHKDGMVEVE